MEEQLRSDERFLATKRAELASPGIKLSDCYYTGINSTVDAAEITFNLGRFNVSLNSLAMGGTSQLNIPNGSLLSNCYLHLVLPPIVANQTICRGWGYNIIQSIQWMAGASSTPVVTITGPSMWTALQAQCETAERGNEMLQLGGEEYIVPTAGNIMADILLELPWSNACGMNGKKPIDTAMLNNPVSIMVTFNQAATIYGGVGAMPAAFVSGNLTALQGVFGNTEQSLAFPLRKDPSLMYAYPFIFKQPFSQAPFMGSNVVGSPVNINLQSFINADLVSLYLYVVQTSNLQSLTGSSPCPFAVDPISNVNLTYNGLPMFVTPDNMHRLINLRNITGAGKFSNSQPVSIPGGGYGPYLSTPFDCYILQINFSKPRADCIGSQMVNTWRIGNNTLNIAFNTSTNNQYQLFATYCYNAVLEFSNGTSAIYF